MSEYDDQRAERAFRQALTDRADDFEPVPLIAPEERRRRWLAPALAAAAALLLILAGGAVAARLLRPDGARTPTSAGPAQPGGLPDGWHWESSRDAMVGVPDSWGYAQAVASDWCAGSRTRSAPRQPFVDTSNGHQSVDLIGCLGSIPESLMTPHLTFSGPSLLPEPRDGWQALHRAVGSADVTVVTDPTHLALAQQILATARAVTVDQNGCPARSPIQRGHFVRPENPFDVAALASVSAISVCQYELKDPASPGLLASRQLTGDAASTLLHQLQAAPIGGGPDEPATCLGTLWGDVGEQLQFTTPTGVQVGYAYHDWCFGNGFDDGTHLRELTTAWCPLLFADRVRINAASSGVFERCASG